MKRILSLMIALALVVTSLVVPVMVSAADDVIIASGDALFSTTGSWSGESSLKGPTGKPAYWSADTKDATATYSAEMLVPGEYEVFYWKNVHTAKNDNAVALEISHSGGISNEVVDCSTGETGWESIGNFKFSESDAEYVKVVRTGKSADVITRSGGIMFRPIRLSASSSTMVEMDEGDKYLYDLFTYLGITSVFDFTDDAKQVTRAEFLAAVMKALDAPSATGVEAFYDVPETHAFYKEVTSARANGIVAGNGEGYFNPDSPIMLEEAAKIAVHSLELLSTIENIGVERANAQGGYKIGYILELNKQGLAKGLPANAENAPLTVESVKVIIRNLLNADIREMITEDRIPVLERVHDIYEGSGKVNSVFGIAVDNKGSIDKGFARIDNTRYELGDLNIDKYIGMETDFYYVDKDGADQIVAMIAQPGVKRIEIDASDIIRTEWNSGSKTVRISYYDENLNVDDETVNMTTDVFYNDVKIVRNGTNTDFADTDFKADNGSLVLVSNNGGSTYDYAFVNSYRTVVVKNINETDKKIYDYYDNANSIDLSLYPDGFEIVKDGRNIEISKVYEWDVLSVPVVKTFNTTPTATTTRGSVAKLQLSRKKVAGVIEAKNSKNSLFIDGTEYELSKSFETIVKSDAREASKIEIGRAVTLYLDVTGKVAAVYEGMDGAEGVKTNYAYIKRTKAARGGLSGKVEIEAFTSATGTWENLKLEDEISYTAKGVTTKIKSEDIVKQDTFVVSKDIKPEDAPAGTFPVAIEAMFNTASTNIIHTGSGSAISNWDTTTSGYRCDQILPGQSEAPRMAYTQANAELYWTYALDSIYLTPANYTISFFMKKNDVNNDNMLVTVTDANGSKDYRFNTKGTSVSGNAGTGFWITIVDPTTNEAAVHTFSGAVGEGITFTHDDPTAYAKKTTRVGDIKLIQDLGSAVEDAQDAWVKAEKEKDNLDKFKNNGAPVDKVIEYTTNSKGFVKEIEVLDNSSHHTAGASYTTSAASRFKNRDGKQVFLTPGGSNNPADFIVDSSTVIFAFPHDADDKDNYSIIPVSELKHDMFYNGIDSYDETDDRYAPVMIIRQYYNEFNNFNGQEPYEVMAVASKLKVLDENKESCVALKGYVGANEKTVLAVEDNLFNNVGIGDIVTLIPNKDGKAYHKVILYDFVEGTPKTDASRYKVKSNMGNQFGCYSGKVVDIANSGTTLFITTNVSDDTKANSTMCNIATPAVYICNEKEQTLTPASVGDISIEDMISIYYNSYSAKMVVIYRED